MLLAPVRLEAGSAPNNYPYGIPSVTHSIRLSLFHQSVSGGGRLKSRKADDLYVLY